MVEDCANAAPTACRSRHREISSLTAVTCAVVVVAVVLGMVTVVLVPGYPETGDTVTMRVAKQPVSINDATEARIIQRLIAMIF